jgi:hypothetical protein
MKYAIEMSSGAMTYIPSFIKIGSGIRKLMGGAHSDTQQQGYLISLFLFSQIRKVRLKIMVICGSVVG